MLAFRAHFRLVLVMLSQGHVEVAQEALKELVNVDLFRSLLCVRYQLQ